MTARVRSDIRTRALPWITIGQSRQKQSPCLIVRPDPSCFCGATVYYEAEGLEEYVIIPVGAFADPGFPVPTVSVYEERMHRWVVPPPDAEHIP